MCSESKVGEILEHSLVFKVYCFSWSSACLLSFLSAVCDVLVLVLSRPLCINGLQPVVFLQNPVGVNSMKANSKVWLDYF